MADRALAHIEEVAWIKPIEGADNIEAIGVLGWNLIAKKNEFQIGDKCVFFEIDSKLPEKEWSKFLESKHYKIKTMKLSKFKVWSQGLALPVRDIPEITENLSIGTDVTDLLGVTYSVAEDNVRKATPTTNPNEKYNRMSRRHPKLAKTRCFRWLMKREWGKKLLFSFFGRKKDNPRGWPSFIKKTDEERIENCPFYLESKDKWVMTEKLDGTSCSFAVERQKKKFEFFVCSRNVRQMDRNQETYHDSNIYWELADKYDIKNKLINLAEDYDYEHVVLQGEGVGLVQGNPYKLKENDLYCFNLVLDGIRTSTPYLKEWCDKNGLKCVPILDINHELPHNMKSMKIEADGLSVINPKVKREGFVYRSQDGQQSFKNVSREYLLKHNG